MIMGKKLKLTSIEHDEGKLIVSVEKCKELHEFLAYLLSDFGFQNKYLSYQQGEMKDIIKLSDLAESYKNRNLDITLFHGNKKVFIVASGPNEDVISKFKKAILYYFEFKKQKTSVINSRPLRKRI